MFAIEMPSLQMRSLATTLKSSRIMRSTLRSDLEINDKEMCAMSLSWMVTNFMEDSDLHKTRSQHLADDTDPSMISTKTIRILKETVRCPDTWERKILGETTKLVMAAEDEVYDANLMRLRVRDGLWSLGFNASLCVSKWGQTPHYPHGHHEYIDVIIRGSYGGDEDEEGRIIIDLELRSEFELARCTSHYASLLNTLPEVFVGRPKRLRRVVAIMAEEAVKSLKRREFHVPPWRRPDYMMCKWFSPYTRRGHRPPLPASKPMAALCPPHIGLLLSDTLSTVELENDEDDGHDEGEELSSSSSSEVEEEVKSWQWNPRPFAFVPMIRRRKVISGLTAVLQ